MDYHDLQRKLFEIEPSNPAEDLAKLQAQASGGATAPATPQPVVESVEVPEGSLPVDKDYSISDFAALAGIKLTEEPQAAPQPADNAQMQKTGMGAKMVGNKLGAKGSAGMMGKALDKVAQGGALPANLASQIAPFAKSLETILADPQLRNKFMTLIKQAEAAQGESVEEADKRLIKPRDPNAQTMQDLRKSGAMGAHKDKKKLSKQGYQKHKSKDYANESIKDRLYAELAKYELKK